MIGIAGCCARAAGGQHSENTAAPPTTAIAFRLLKPLVT
jgi:hypothetical protein